MSKNCSLSEVQRCQIVILYKEGHTERQIRERLGCSKTTVNQAIVKFKEPGTYAGAKRSSCLRKTTSRTDILIKSKVMNSPTCSVKKIRADLNETGISVSSGLLAEFVEQFGLKSRKPRFILKIKKRLHFALQHKEWTCVQWSKAGVRKYFLVRPKKYFP